MVNRRFNLEEARALIPELRVLLQEANDDLSSKAATVRVAATEYDEAESELDSHSGDEDFLVLRTKRARFASAIEELSKSQHAYVNSFNDWVEKVTSRGVILRDLREGLLDFPARENGFDYLLCWRTDETDINFWHLEQDGFSGRKPLTALSEYS